MCRVCGVRRVEIGTRCMHCREIQRKSQQKANIRNYRRNRAGVLALLGELCACCGEDEEAFLCVDHVHGGGNAHRRAIGSGSSDGLYRWILKQPAEAMRLMFQTLCWNCNHAKHKLGACPHQGGME